MEVLEETKEIMRRVLDETGRPIFAEPDESLTTDGTWTYKGDHHLVRYHPRWSEHLNHTIAHEAGHIFRLWPEDKERFYLPASTRTTRSRASQDLRHDYMELARRGLPIEAIRATADFVYRGAVQQVTNVAIDIRIEGWIRQEYPGLREVQRSALEQDVRERYAALHPIIRETNPLRIYRANQVLNAAWTESVRLLLDEPELVRPYRGTRYRTLAKRLLRHLRDQPDRGASGDRDEVDHWAGELGMSGWYVWTEVPK